MEDQQTIIKPGLELAVFDAEAEIKKFPIKIEDLKALAAKYAGLTINGLADVEGYKAVVAARKDVKKMRVHIQNTGKDVRDGAVKFQKLVIAKENEFVAVIEPTEDRLEDLEIRWERLKEEDEKEKERAKAARIQSMQSQLTAVEYAVDIFDLQAMSDEQFYELLRNATADFEVIKVKREEERKAKLEESIQLELERQKRERELEKQRVEQEAAQKVLEEAQAKLKAEQDQIAADRLKIEEEKASALKQRTKLREARLQAVGFKAMAIGYVYTTPFTKKETHVLTGLIQTTSDEDWEQCFESAFSAVARNNAEDIAAKEAHDAEQAKLKKQREKTEKEEKMLRQGDSRNFGVIRQDIEAVIRQFQTKAGAPTFKSKWGQLAVETIKGKLNEAIDICKANEPTDEQTSNVQ